MELKQFTTEAFDNAFANKSAAEMIAAMQQQDVKIPEEKKIEEETQQRSAADMAANPEKKLEEEKKVEEEKTEEQKAAELTANAEAEKKKAGRPPAEIKLDDNTKTIVNALIKDGKLRPFQDGKIETQRDIAELLEANVSYQLDEEKKTILDKVFNSMSPALQIVAQYAQYIQNPQELLPIINSTSNHEKFKALDDNNPAHHEMIVRERLRLNGDSDEVIEQEITELKDSAKLAAKAKTYKPVVEQYYARETKKLMDAEAAKEREYEQIIQRNHEEIVKVLGAPKLDGMQLKQQHKSLAYELLAEPREEYGGGVGIYAVIDKLFAEGKFTTLTKLALLAADESAFDSVYSTKVKLNESDRVGRILQTASTTGGPITTDEEIIKQQQEAGLQRPTRTGFGFDKRK